MGRAISVNASTRVLGEIFFAIVLITVCSVDGLTQTTAPTPIVTVQVDAGCLTEPYDPVWNYFDADEPNYSYLANGQEVFRQLSQLSRLVIFGLCLVLSRVSL